MRRRGGIFRQDIVGRLFHTFVAFYSFFLVGAVLIMLFMQCASLCAGAGPGGVPGTGA